MLSSDTVFSASELSSATALGLSKLLAIESAPDDHTAPFGGALHDILVAELQAGAPMDTWTRPSIHGAYPVPGAFWSRSFALTANSYDFPAGSIPTAGPAGEGGLPFDDLRAFYTAVYASPAGQRTWQRRGGPGWG